MRVVLQRVREASVSVDGQVISRIGRGCLLLVGIHQTDTEAELEWMAAKVAELRIFEDDQGKMNRSTREVGGEFLVVSQFTLYGDARKGRRPSYSEAARPEHARPMCERFAELLRAQGYGVAEGSFGAMMQVSLVNDGPVTLVLERHSEAKSTG